MLRKERLAFSAIIASATILPDPRARADEASIPLQQSKIVKVQCIIGSRSEIEARVIKLVSEHMGIEIAEITSNSNLVDDLRFDSLDRVELIMAAEEAFSIEIPEDRCERWTTIRDAVEFIWRERCGNADEKSGAEP